ncbi:hypothetical protein L226DRAFT_321783 [Lentinus tigrinus ALCF2SS1-7]|uniref:uncharacterized protein n=1 Tax=Lentinus tigrinus ALCF2SS1-7 TaxID=1328758 RepID=UPI001165CC71|nr:hypothetical protein L226DRAFT_321783 [Lentinus tigrinus ALCF2SS1-7]
MHHPVPVWLLASGFWPCCVFIEYVVYVAESRSHGGAPSRGARCSVRVVPFASLFSSFILHFSFVFRGDDADPSGLRSRTSLPLPVTCCLLPVACCLYRALLLYYYHYSLLSMTMDVHSSACCCARNNVVCVFCMFVLPPPHPYPPQIMHTVSSYISPPALALTLALALVLVLAMAGR